MKKFFISAMMLSGVITFAQNTGKVGINQSKPTATLNVKSKTGKDATTKNLELENANGTKLVTVLDNGNVGIGVEKPTQKLEVTGKVKITDGTQGRGKVLTSDANGNASWQPMTQIVNNNVTYSVTSQVDYNILGYIPSDVVTATSAPSSVSHNGKTANKLGTHTFTGNGHSYATYASANYITWYEAYEMAKSMGGYLATFTNDEEWQSVETALLDKNTTFDTTGAWIGMARFQWFAGVGLQPAVEMKWITGEQPRHDYSLGGNSSVRKSNWFYQQEQVQPDNAGGVEGFVHTTRKNRGRSKIVNGYTSRHPWNDQAANHTADENMKAFIVEFQQ